MKATTPLQARRIRTPKSRSLPGFLPYGDNDRWPQQLHEVIRESPTASACIAARAEYIAGNGFRDKNLWKMVIHRSGLTMDKLLKKTADSISENEAMAFHITYNGLGKIAGIRPVSVPIVRLCEPDDNNYISHAGLFPYLDSDFFVRRQKDHTKIHLFNPNPEVVLSQIEEAGGIANYRGQLAYINLSSSDGYYPEPSFFSAIKDIESEGQLSLYDFNSIASGFNISGILTILDNDNKPEGYNPLSDATSVEYQISNFQGAENTGAFIVNRVKTKDQMEATKFESFTGTDLAKRYESTTTRVEYRIARAMRVPNDIAGIQRPNGAFYTSTDLETAGLVLQRTVNPWQRAIEDFFQNEVFPNWKEPVPVTDFSIQNLDLHSNGSVAQPAGNPVNSSAA